MKAEELQKDLEQCAEHLMPLFGLEGKLDIEVEHEIRAIDIYQEEEAALRKVDQRNVVPGAMLSDEMSIRIEYDRETLYDANEDSPPRAPEDVGYFIGEILLEKVNPVMCDLGRGPPKDKALLARYEAHRIVAEVIPYMCGISFDELRGDHKASGTYDPDKKDQEEQFIDRSLIGTEENRRRLARRNELVEVIAEDLFEKRGPDAIAYLARASLKDARRYILTETLKDIMDPDEGRF